MAKKQAQDALQVHAGVITDIDDMENGTFIIHFEYDDSEGRTRKHTYVLPDSGVNCLIRDAGDAEDWIDLLDHEIVAYEINRKFQSWDIKGVL